MKTLILYATKYGSTKKCAEILAKSLKAPYDLVNVRDKFVYELDGYDTIIFGSSIKMGVLDRKIKHFIEKKQAAIADKKLGMFITGGMAEQVDEILKKNLPAQFLSKCKAIHYVGGEINKSKSKGIDKFILKMAGVAMEKENAKPPHILENNIKMLADLMNGTK